LGFEVYHDLPFEGFNMDHVLVGCQGVYGYHAENGPARLTLKPALTVPSLCGSRRTAGAINGMSGRARLSVPQARCNG
jgi:hypothetical protein